MNYILLIILFSVFFQTSVFGAEDIRDVKPPELFPPNFGFFIALLIFLLLAVLVWFLRRVTLPRREKKTKVPPAPPPWTVAFQRLTALKEAGFPAQGQVKAYYTELSDILRRYMEGRFDIKAPEMTTEEFLIYLKQNSALNVRQKQSLQDFLNCCDMVKFAKFSSSTAEMEQSFDLAWRLIEETQPQAMPSRQPSLSVRK